VLLFEYDRGIEEVAEKRLLPATNQKVARSSRAGRTLKSIVYRHRTVPFSIGARFPARIRFIFNVNQLRGLFLAEPNIAPLRSACSLRSRSIQLSYGRF
jgi:hypothetical protein